MTRNDRTFGRRVARCAPCGIALFFVLAVPAARAADENGPRQPNILVIVADDLGYGELGCYGGTEIPTPSLDRLARDGVRCTHGYVSCPVCSPTRAGLLTGRYQQRFGHEFNPGPAQAARNFGLPRDEVTLASRLKGAGYATGLVGKWHLGYREGFRPLDRGFDEFFGFLGGAHPYLPGRRNRAQEILRANATVEERDYLTDAFTREALAFIERNRERPFFLYLAYNAVHNPLEADQGRLERFASLADERRRRFAAMLTALDEGVGTVLAKLRESELDGKTLVFFLSDNGGPTRQTTSRNGPLRGVKGQVWEGGIRVPFLVRYTGRLPAGRVFEHPVIALDIHPTARAAAGLDMPVRPIDPPLDGVNLLPHLDGASDKPPHEALFWRLGDQQAVRKGNFKLVRDRTADEWLTDLAADEGESQNLASNRPDVLTELGEALAQWERQLSQPLWPRR